MATTIPENVTVIANSNEELQVGLIHAQLNGMSVRDTNLWEGVVPPNSFCEVMPTVRMSTPEYMAFRKANQLDHDSAVLVMCELLTPYTTDVINPNFGKHEIRKNNFPHTTIEDMVVYLSPVMETEEGMKALEILHDALRYVDAYEAMCEIAYKSFNHMD